MKMIMTRDTDLNCHIQRYCEQLQLYTLVDIF